MKNKSILFIADKRDWAYHNIIKTWAEFLTDFDCYIAFSEDYMVNFSKFSLMELFTSNSINKIRGKSMYRKIDTSRLFSFPVYKQNPVYEVKNMALVDKNEFDIQIEMAYYFQYISKLPFLASTKLVGLYTDSFPHEGPSFDHFKNQNVHHLNREEFYENYLKNYDGLIVGNINLFNIYNSFTENLVCSNGIYLQNEFKENKKVGENNMLTIGWTGNPNRSMKGFKEVIVPAVEELQSAGLKIKLKTKFSGPYYELLDFYTDVDLVVIASEADTGPSLFAEASLSNVPSISTKIGFPQAVIQNGVNGVFSDRNKDDFKKHITELYKDRQKLKDFSKRIKADYLSSNDNKIMAAALLMFLARKLND
ncbi:MAG: glycosyltransferase [Weeksellaceae bacterium]